MHQIKGKQCVTGFARYANALIYAVADAEQIYSEVLRWDMIVYNY